jgi:hypothetical protein
VTWHRPNHERELGAHALPVAWVRHSHGLHCVNASTEWRRETLGNGTTRVNCLRIDLNLSAVLRRLSLFNISEHAHQWTPPERAFPPQGLFKANSEAHCQMAKQKKFNARSIVRRM